jgi:hypothetical protein
MKLSAGLPDLVRLIPVKIIPRNLIGIFSEIGFGWLRCKKILFLATECNGIPMLLEIL